MTQIGLLYGNRGFTDEQSIQSGNVAASRCVGV
jgi:hypothetical protein